MEIVWRLSMAFSPACQNLQVGPAGFGSRRGEPRLVDCEGESEVHFHILEGTNAGKTLVRVLGGTGFGGDVDPSEHIHSHARAAGAAARWSD